MSGAVFRNDSMVFTSNVLDHTNVSNDINKITSTSAGHVTLSGPSASADVMVPSDSPSLSYAGLSGARMRYTADDIKLYFPLDSTFYVNRGSHPWMAVTQATVEGDYFVSIPQATVTLTFDWQNMTLPNQTRDLGQYSVNTFGNGPDAFLGYNDWYGGELPSNIMLGGTHDNETNTITVAKVFSQMEGGVLYSGVELSWMHSSPSVPNEAIIPIHTVDLNSKHSFFSVTREEEASPGVFTHVQTSRSDVFYEAYNYAHYNFNNPGPGLQFTPMPTFTQLPVDGDDCLLHGLATPTTGTDAANKSYVDNTIAATTSFSSVSSAGSVDVGGSIVVAVDARVSGNAVITGNITAQSLTSTSDERLKSHITNMTPEDAIELVKALRPVTYNWKGSGDADIGFIAQEVQDIVPSVVHEDRNGMLSVEYGKLVTLLLCVVQCLLQD